MDTRRILNTVGELFIDKKCTFHGKQLIRCPIKNCTDCWYVDICNRHTKVFCPTCGSVINRLRELRARGAAIVNSNLRIAKQRLSELNRRKGVMMDEVEGARDDVAKWSGMPIEAVMDDLHRMAGLGEAKCGRPE